MEEEDKTLEMMRKRDVDILLLELKVLVAELNIGRIDQQEYERKRDAIVVKLIEER